MKLHRVRTYCCFRVAAASKSRIQHSLGQAWNQPAPPLLCVLALRRSGGGSVA